MCVVAYLCRFEFKMADVARAIISPKMAVEGTVASSLCCLHKMPSAVCVCVCDVGVCSTSWHVSPCKEHQRGLTRSIHGRRVQGNGRRTVCRT